MAEKQRKRLIFMGTPLFAAIVLEKLLACDKFDLEAVFCGPDRKSGRGLKTVFSETKKIALENGIPIFQPASLKTPEVYEQLRDLEPDFLIVAAYGQLIPARILEIPKYAAINVHASLLPAYRGAAPIQRAIMENWQPNSKTGVSIMKMAPELDAGPVYSSMSVPIGRHDRRSLEKELAALGGELLIETLENICDNDLKPLEQNEDLVSWARKLEKADGIIDWNKTVAEVDAHVRGVSPWPGAQTWIMLLGKDGSTPVTLLPGEPGEKADNLQPGQIERTRSGLRIACADGWYEPGAIRPEGHREMSLSAFANGHCKVKTGLCGVASSKK